jgi:hypothetical protein
MGHNDQVASLSLPFLPTSSIGSMAIVERMLMAEAPAVAGR